MYRQTVQAIAIAVSLCGTCSTASKAQEPAVSVSIRNTLREGGYIAQFELLDAQGAVVGLTTQRVENGAIGTISVSPGSRFNIRVLPDGGGGHVYSNRDLVADFKENDDKPLDLEGRFDPVTGRRIALILHIGKKEIVAPRMEYDYASSDSQDQARASCNCDQQPSRSERHRLIGLRRYH